MKDRNEKIDGHFLSRGVIGRGGDELVSEIVDFIIQKSGISAKSSKIDREIQRYYQYLIEKPSIGTEFRYEEAKKFINKIRKQIEEIHKNEENKNEESRYNFWLKENSFIEEGTPTLVYGIKFTQIESPDVNNVSIALENGTLEKDERKIPRMMNEKDIEERIKRIGSIGDEYFSL